MTGGFIWMKSFIQYNYGRECYNFAEHYCPRLKKDFERCWECPWFKKIRPDFNLEEHDIFEKEIYRKYIEITRNIYRTI